MCPSPPDLRYQTKKITKRSGTATQRTAHGSEITCVLGNSV
jgi:hypothetical protein